MFLYNVHMKRSSYRKLKYMVILYPCLVNELLVFALKKTDLRNSRISAYHCHCTFLSDRLMKNCSFSRKRHSFKKCKDEYFSPFIDTLSL